MYKKFSRLTLIAIVAVLLCFPMVGCASNSTNNSQLTCTHSEQSSTGLDINALYQMYITEYPSGSFEEFLKLLNYYDTSYATSKAVNSVVTIYSTFTKNTMVRPGQYISSDVIAAGSGVIYEIRGNDVFIITNYHVIYDRDSTTANSRAKKIAVYANAHEDTEILAEFVSGSKENDIAVIKASLSNFHDCITAATISKDLYLGERVIAIGNPLAAGISVTSGVVSVAYEEITMEALDDAKKTVTIGVIRTDTAINSGNSGGGLFNIYGELIGIVNAKTVESGVENMGYAIPIKTVLELIKEKAIVF